MTQRNAKTIHGHGLGGHFANLNNFGGRGITQFNMITDYNEDLVSAINIGFLMFQLLSKFWEMGRVSV